MTKTTIKEKVLKELSEHPYCTEDTVTEGMSLREDLGFDSLDVVTFVMELEEEFEIELEDEAIEDVKTILDLAELIAKVKGVTDE